MMAVLGEWVELRQHFPRPRVPNPAGAVGRMLQQAFVTRVRPGMQVAIAVGSRGIGGIGALVQATVRTFEEMGAVPFIISAMGSHGGGTVAGQTEVLRHLGITEAAVGAPLRITDQAVPIGETDQGDVLWCDAEAAAADGLILINRVKPHTSFTGPLESGIFKMLSVGLGKVPGATQVHRLGAAAIYPAIRAMGRLALARLPILGGIAIIENGFGEAARIEVLLPEQIEAAEAELLIEARRLLPALPVSNLDLLIVEEMGKNFSGTGMDTNVIGRLKVPGLPEPAAPSICRIVTLGLSAASGGNANGIGLADFITTRLLRAVDWPTTYLNIRTTGFWARAFCPPVLASDREAIDWAADSLRLNPARPIRAARIRSTLHLEKMHVNLPAAADLAGRANIDVGRHRGALEYNSAGDLIPWH